MTEERLSEIRARLAERGDTIGIIAREDLRDLLAEVEAERGLRMTFERAVAHLEAENDTMARTILDLRTNLKDAHAEALRLRRRPDLSAPRTKSPLLHNPDGPFRTGAALIVEVTP